MKSAKMCLSALMLGFMAVYGVSALAQQAAEPGLQNPNQNKNIRKGVKAFAKPQVKKQQLNNSPEESAVQVLINTLLKHEHVFTRSGAIYKLGELYKIIKAAGPAKQAIREKINTALVKALNDKSSRVAAKALCALCEWADNKKAAEEFFDKQKQVMLNPDIPQPNKLRAIKIMTSIHLPKVLYEKRIPVLCQILRQQKDPKIILAIINALPTYEINQTIFNGLMVVLANTSDKKIREKISSAVRFMFSEASKEQKLRITSPITIQSVHIKENRRLVAEIFAHINTDKSVCSLIYALNHDEDLETRHIAAKSLSEILLRNHYEEDQKARCNLIKNTFLHVVKYGKDLELRKITLDSLDTFFELDIIEPLCEVLERDTCAVFKKHVLDSMSWILGKIKNPYRKITPEEMKKVDYAGSVLTKLFLDEKDPKVRAATADLLGEIKYKKAAGVLIYAISHKENDVEISAIKALAQLKAPDALIPITHVLNNPDFIKWAVVKELLRFKEIDPVEVRETLISLLGSKYSLVRGEAARALGMLGDKKALPALTQALKDKEPYVVEEVVWAINELRGLNK